MQKRLNLLILLPLLVWILASALAIAPYLRIAVPWKQEQPPLSTVRMQTDLRILADSPREPGTPGHAAARTYLAQKLKDLGFEVEIQPVSAAGQNAPLENIVARLPGRSGQNALALVAHYDSVPGGAGASDDASGVAIVLEIARGVLAAPRPNNDLVILLADGEELGVLGSPEFTGRHPLMKKVKAALNFDGISYGPVLLWQTSPRNGWLVEQYASGTPYPMGASWIDGIARALPLGTDLEPFTAAGVTGGSFTTAYLPMTAHSSLDTIAGVTTASLESGHDQGLALTLRLLNADLADPRAPDLNYLTVWGPMMLRYPAEFTLYFSIASFVLFGAAVFFNFYLGRAAWKPMLIAFGRALLFQLANLLLAALAQLLIEVITFFAFPALSPFIKTAVSVTLVLFLMLVTHGRMRRSTPPRMLLLAGQFLWAALALASGIAQPLFVTPLMLILLASLIPWIFELAPALPFWAGDTARLASAGLALFFAAPVIYLLYMVSGIMFVPAVIGAAFWALVMAILLPISAPSGLDAAS